MKPNLVITGTFAALTFALTASPSGAAGINTTRSNIKSSASEAPNSATINTTRSNIKSSAASAPVTDVFATEDNSVNEATVNAESIVTENTDASVNSDSSTTTDNSVNNVAGSDGGATAAGGNASYTDASTKQTATAGGGNASTSIFGDGAVVSTAQLSSNVSGVTVGQPSAANPQAQPVSVSLSGNVQQNFAGVQNLSLSTGPATAVTQSISFAGNPTPP